MKKILENWQAYKKSILNEVDPSLMRGSPVDYSKDPEQDERAKKWKKWADKKKKDTSAMKQRVVRSHEKAKDVDLGIPGGDKEYGTMDPERMQAIRQTLSGPEGRMSTEPGYLYTDEELDTAQMAGEFGLVPAEAAIAGGLAGAKAAAYASPAAAGLAAGEAVVAAADSPYALRPGRAEQHRSMADKNLAVYFRSRRIQRKTDPRLQTRDKLEKDLRQVKKYIDKTASGNIIVRGGGEYLGKAADEAKLSGLLASEIKANFLDIRKRLIALKKKQGQRRKYNLSPTSESNANSQLKALIKEEYKRTLLKESIQRIIDLVNDFKRLGRGFRMDADDVRVVEELINTRQIHPEDLPEGFLEKVKEAGAEVTAPVPAAPPAGQAPPKPSGAGVAGQARQLHPNAVNLQRIDAMVFDKDYYYVIVNTTQGPVPFYRSTGRNEIAGETGWLPFAGENIRGHFMKLSENHPQARKGWVSDRDGEIKNGKYSAEGSEFHDIGQAIETQGWNKGVPGGGWHSPADFLSNNMHSLTPGMSSKQIADQLNRGMEAMGYAARVNEKLIDAIGMNLHIRANGVNIGALTDHHKVGEQGIVPGIDYMIDQGTFMKAMAKGHRVATGGLTHTRESYQPPKLKIMLG